MYEKRRTKKKTTEKHEKKCTNVFGRKKNDRIEDFTVFAAADAAAVPNIN